MSSSLTICFPELKIIVCYNRMYPYDNHPILALVHFEHMLSLQHLK